ncbi:hypothetical protein [Paenibacillus contaminans]|uniref:Beta-galactosidase n=1 Tax=Paenibacillus contaminans TaxID=450362 RepID=A0A329MUE9_9BACL|nr:hypothetical protein [Paenibacillus contaminans]RAV23302.1 hypothetical protein DQG23_03670 [Paenibacillus contaminans]
MTARNDRPIKEQNDRLQKELVQYIYRPGWTLLENETLWKEALDFAEKTGADAIMAFNAHGEMPPHPPLEELPQRVALLAERFAEVRRRGMIPMLNYFVTLGHGAAKPAAGMEHFQPVVDGFGHAVQGCACPLDPVFQQYMVQSFSLYAEGLDIESLWIDDDFRLYGREGAETLQCFCPLHLKQFAHKVGRSYERGELIRLLLDHREPQRELRRQWFEVQGESLVRLAKLLRDAVTAANPDIALGMMIPPVYYNYFSGRKLNEELHALYVEGRTPWLRTGGGFYRDERPLDLLDKVIQVADPIPSMLTEPVRLCCEIENYPFVPGLKSAQALALEMYLNTISTNGLLTLSIHDSFLGMHDISGNVAKMLPAVKPYLRQVALTASGKRRRGASLSFPPNLAEIGELGSESFIPQWNLNLARLGIPQAPTDASPVILTGHVPELFSEGELRKMLERGAILSPETYVRLQELGLLLDCPIQVTKEPFKSKVQTERILTDGAPEWLRGKNLAARWHVTYQTEYTVQALEGAEMWSCLYDTEGVALSCGVAVAENPYRVAVMTHTGLPMKERGRQWLMQQAIAFLTHGDCPAMVENVLEMYPIWWEASDEDGVEAMLGLCHFAMESYDTVTLWLPGERSIRSIERLERSGEWTAAACTITVHESGGQRITLTDASVPKPLSYETFRIYR